MRVSQRCPFVQSSPLDKVGVQGPATILLGKKEKLLSCITSSPWYRASEPIGLELRQLNSGA